MAQYTGKQARKRSKNHQTYITEADEVSRFLRKSEDVSKVACARIVGNKATRTRGLEIRDERVGLEVRVFGSAGCQTLYVHTKEPDTVRSRLINKFGERTK